MRQPATKLAVIEGVRPILEALRAGRRRVLQVTLPAGDGSPGRRELEARLREAGVAVVDGPAKGGVHARAEAYPEEPFEALLDEPRPGPWLVALDGVTDVGNLGSIARSAEGAGATGIVLEERRAPPIGPGALRSSAGALEHLRVGRTPNLRRSLDLARAEGLVVLAADMAGEALDAVAPEGLTGPLIWVFGSEDRGARPSILQAAQHRVAIPLHGRVESLGVAAAAAYLLLRTAEIRRDALRRGAVVGSTHRSA